MTTPPIEDQTRALMSAWAEQRAPSAEIRERTWAAVTARANAGDLGPELGVEPNGLAELATTIRPRLVLLSLGTTIVAAAIVLAAIGRGSNERGSDPASARDRASVSASATPAEPEPEAPANPTEPEAPANPPEAPANPPEPEAPANQAEPAQAEVPLAAPTTRPAKLASKLQTEPASPSKDTGAPAPGQDDLAAELALLGRARAALKAGDPEAALAVLEEHHDRFPNGALRSERELTRITAACAAGDLDRAERVARRFVAAHPGSTEAKRLADTCIGDRL